MKVLVNLRSQIFFNLWYKTLIAEKMSLLTNKLFVTRFNQYIYNRKDYIDDVFWKHLLIFLPKKKLKKVQKLCDDCFFTLRARILYQFVMTKAYYSPKLFFQNPFAPDQPLLFILSINKSYTTKNQKGETHEIYFFNLQSDFEKHS